MCEEMLKSGHRERMLRSSDRRKKMVTETAELLQKLWKFKNINMKGRRQGYDKEFSEVAWGRERVMS